MARTGDTGSTRKTGPKSDIVQLGSGPFTTEEDVTNRARYHFLQSIRRKCPEPLFALRDTIFPLYRDWAESVLMQAYEVEAWNQSSEAAEDTARLEAIFRDIGLSEAAAKAAAKGRPPRGTSPEDPIFKEFMLMQYEAPILERALMEWAQHFNLTHAREFEEAPRVEQAATATGVTEFEKVELVLHEQYWACQWAVQTWVRDMEMTIRKFSFFVAENLA